ncbi:ead/Ea22-like family protein [Klebsiella pneumoniae]|nr:ead/Ea22-like family protein [Klebsiella pneumoniae]EKW1794099.1 ead/Ea22-like family protein [Klebsiella pneumoniae]HBY4457372.1 ead/Ea22-like family protein [Klebsiella pneumoniae]
MIDITKLTAEKLEEIRQRYRPTLAPKCHICGVEMTIQRMSASRITYGCAGAIYDETGCHYAEGRSLADDHYAESRITVVDVSDPDVLAMVEALEKAQAENTAGVAGMAESYETTISMLRSRIAGLEARTVTVKQGEVLVTVAGFTGCGKSAIAGEIEIAMKAIGLPVTWANGDSEKRMTGADWLTAIEMYKPTVRIVEVNIPRAAGIKVEAE